MEIYAQKLQKIEKLGDLQLILTVTTPKIIFPSGKPILENQKGAPFWYDLL